MDINIRLCNLILKAVVKIFNKEEDPEKALIFAMDMVMAIERYTCRRVTMEHYECRGADIKRNSPKLYRMYIED